MVSINVRSKPCSPHQLIRLSNSSSLKPFKATVLILIFSPTRFASDKPLITSSSVPHLVIFVNFSLTNESNETFTLLIPFSTNCSAYFSSKLPLVVSVNSLSIPVFMKEPNDLIRFIMFRRTNGSPPVSRILSTPREINAIQSRSSSSRVNKSDFGRNVIFSDIQYRQR